MTTNSKIDVKLTRTNLLVRWGCTVCGGHTDKEGVLAEGPDGITVCAPCLKAGDIDARLGRHAAQLAQAAANVQDLIGRLNVPTFAEWRAEMDRWEAEEEAASAEADRREAEALGCTIDELHHGQDPRPWRAKQ
jgi:hypothetical protein